MNCANHPDRERQAFCQNCGKPLCRECARTVGQAVFCEPCLEQRLAAANAATQAASQGFPQTPAQPAPGASSTNYGTGPAASSTTYHDIPGTGPAYTYAGPGSGAPSNSGGVRPPAGTPNPIVAGLLGFIPGVGAMYNGQYAKGIVHLVIFAVLTSLADAYGIFGIFVAAWIFYQAIEAYHTANARRDGTQLPNPFGFNDVGERFGFGRAWPTSATNPAPPVTPPPFTPAPPAPAQAPYAASDSFRPPFATPMANPYAAAEPAPAPDSPGAPYSSVPGASTSGTYAQETYTPGTYPSATYVPVSTSASTSSPLPIGAIVLIGLGILFLLGNTHWLSSLPIHLLLPVLLIGLGVWLFVRRMLSFGAGLADDGTPGYQMRVLQALQGSVWIILVGILFLLDSLRILSWGHSWPLFLIVGGVIFFLQRSAASSAAGHIPMPVSPIPPAGTVVPPAPGNSRDAEQP